MKKGEKVTAAVLIFGYGYGIIGVKSKIFASARVTFIIYTHRRVGYIA